MRHDAHQHLLSCRVKYACTEPHKGAGASSISVVLEKVRLWVTTSMCDAVMPMALLVAMQLLRLKQDPTGIPLQVYPPFLIFFVRGNF
jgi:hypothetical protein